MCCDGPNGTPHLQPIFFFVYFPSLTVTGTSFMAEAAYIEPLDSFLTLTGIDEFDCIEK